MKGSASGGCCGGGEKSREHNLEQELRGQLDHRQGKKGRLAHLCLSTYVGVALLTEPGADQGAGALSTWEGEGAMLVTTEFKCLWNIHEAAG